MTVQLEKNFYDYEIYSVLKNDQKNKKKRQKEASVALQDTMITKNLI